MTKRGEGHLFKRDGSPFWWISYYGHGKAHRGVARDRRTNQKLLANPSTMKEAQRFLAEQVGAVKAEKYGARAFVPPSKITVNSLLDDLVAEYKLGGKRGVAREMNPQMQSHLKRVRWHFGAWRASAVRRTHVLAFIESLRKEGLSNGTINRSTQLLGQAFRIAATADPPKVSRELSIPKQDESDNVRQGKFSPQEAELVAASLPDYLADVARFAYETGARAGEILKLKWSYLSDGGIDVPSTDTKNRTPRVIAITPEIQKILDRRSADRRKSCELIFHHDGHAIVDYRKSWSTACVINGLGHFTCRTCSTVLDAERRCPKCDENDERPKYIGRLFHDFRRSAAHEMWKSGVTEQDAMKVTGHKTASMFQRYADIFSKQEVQQRQIEAQERRREWREKQPKNLVVMAGNGKAS